MSRTIFNSICPDSARAMTGYVFQTGIALPDMALEGQVRNLKRRKYGGICCACMAEAGRPQMMLGCWTGLRGFTEKKITNFNRKMKLGQ